MSAALLPAGFCLQWLCLPAESCFLLNSDQEPFASSQCLWKKQSRESAALHQSYGVKHITSPFFALFTGPAEAGKETSALSQSKLATGGTKPGVPETQTMLKTTGRTGGRREPSVDWITRQSLLQQSLKVGDVLQTGHYLHLHVDIFLLTE